MACFDFIASFRSVKMLWSHVTPCAPRAEIVSNPVCRRIERGFRQRVGVLFDSDFAFANFQASGHQMADAAVWLKISDETSFLTLF